MGSSEVSASESMFYRAAALDLEMFDRFSRQEQVSEVNVEYVISAYEDALGGGLSGEQAVYSYCYSGFWLNLLSGVSGESALLQKYGSEAAPYAAKAMAKYEKGLELDAKGAQSLFVDTQEQNRHFNHVTTIQRAWVFNSMSMQSVALSSDRADIRYLEKKILPLASHLSFCNPFWMVAGRLGELYHAATEVEPSRRNFESAIKWFDYALGNAGTDRADRRQVVAVWRDRRMDSVTRFRRL